MLHREGKPGFPYVTEILKKRPAGPVVAASDYMKIFADQLRLLMPRDRVYRVLGTDGFGRSDTRPKLRRSEEHTSELQSPCNLVCRLLLEKKKKNNIETSIAIMYHQR